MSESMNRRILGIVEDLLKTKPTGVNCHDVADVLIAKGFYLDREAATLNASIRLSDLRQAGHLASMLQPCRTGRWICHYGRPHRKLKSEKVERPPQRKRKRKASAVKTVEQAQIAPSVELALAPTPVEPMIGSVVEQPKQGVRNRVSALIAAILPRRVADRYAERLKETA